MDEELIEVFTKNKINQFGISQYNSNSGEYYIWNEKIPSLHYGVTYLVYKLMLDLFKANSLLMLIRQMDSAINNTKSMPSTLKLVNLK